MTSEQFYLILKLHIRLVSFERTPTETLYSKQYIWGYKLESVMELNNTSVYNARENIRQNAVIKYKALDINIIIRWIMRRLEFEMKGGKTK